MNKLVGYLGLAAARRTPDDEDASTVNGGLFEEVTAQLAKCVFSAREYRSRSGAFGIT